MGQRLSKIWQPKNIILKKTLRKNLHSDVSGLTQKISTASFLTYKILQLGHKLGDFAKKTFDTRFCCFRLFLRKVLFFNWWSSESKINVKNNGYVIRNALYNKPICSNLLSSNFKGKFTSGFSQINFASSPGRDRCRFILPVLVIWTDLTENLR